MGVKSIMYKKITLFLSTLSLLLVGMGFIGSESIADSDKGWILENSILKPIYKYPKRDEYQYVPEFCAVKMEVVDLQREGKPATGDLAESANRVAKKLGRTSWSWLHHY